MARLAVVKIPLSSEQRERIRVASGAEVSEFVFSGEVDQDEAIISEPHSGLERAVASKLSGKLSRVRDADKTPGYAPALLGTIR